MSLILTPESENGLKEKLTLAAQNAFKDVSPEIRVLLRSRMIHFDFPYAGTVWFKQLNKLKKEISGISVTATDFATFKEKRVFKLRAPPNLFSVSAMADGFVRISIIIQLDEKEEV